MELHPLKMAALVALGGALGALGRYYTSLGMKQLLGNNWPWGTLTVNLVGCFLLGLLASSSSHRGWPGPGLSLLVMTGSLGALTTFSTFSVESVKLLKQGDLWPAVSYLLISVLGGLTMAALGFWLETWHHQR